MILLSTPQILTPVYNAVIYRFSSINYTKSGYRYIFSVYKGTETIGQFKVMPTIDGTGYIDISKVLSNFVDVDFNPSSNTISNATYSYIDYNIKVNEEWAVNWSFNQIGKRSGGTYSGNYIITQTPGITASTYIIGDQINITTDIPAGDLQLSINGLHTIKEVLSNYSYVIDIANPTGTSSVIGIASYADGRKTIGGDYVTSSAIAFNGVKSWKDLPSYLSTEHLDITATQSNINLLTSLKPLVDNTGLFGPRFSNAYRWVIGNPMTSGAFSLGNYYLNQWSLSINRFDVTGTQRQSWLSDIINAWYSFDTVRIYITQVNNPANFGSFEMIQWGTPSSFYSYSMIPIDISHLTIIYGFGIEYSISYSVEDAVELIDKEFYMTPDQDLWLNIATADPTKQYKLVQYTPETGTSEMDILGIGSVKQFKISVNNNSLIPLTTMTTAPISYVSFYLIDLSTELQVSEVYKILIDNRCKIEDYEIAFMDRMGSILSYSFPLRSRETGSIVKEQFKKQVNYNETSTSYSNIYNTYDRGSTINSVNVNKDLELNTNWMNDGMSVLFEELLTSPYTWVKIDGKYYSCIVNELTFEIQRQKNKRLIRKTVSVKMANENIINI